jgi:phosphate transport system permease protein
MSVGWDIQFVGRERVVTSRLREPAVVELGADGVSIERFAVRSGDDTTAIGWRSDGHLAISRVETTENPFTGERTAVLTRKLFDTPYRLRQLVLDPDQRIAYAAADGGRLIWWDLSRPAPGLGHVIDSGRSEITSLALLIGGLGLVAGHEDGTVSVWHRIRHSPVRTRLERIRDLEGLTDAVERISPSLRNRSFLVQAANGELGLLHSTSSRTLWRGSGPDGPVTAMTFSPKGDGAYLATPDGITSYTIHNPHPEFGLRALFGKTLYEGYPTPEFVWQSTGGTDDFEPKLSLTPLVVGTLKGTFYSLLLAIPLGILGALYTSQFVHPRFQRVIKPTVEIMAALPSVVLGFVGGLWLAPRLEQTFPALLLMVIVLPILILLAGWAWSSIPKRLTARLTDGSEVFFFAIVLVAGIALCDSWSASLEAFLFGEGFSVWLFEQTGLTYDQRNAVVVGIAMGFAVIPIIFSISEDALSSVPRLLSAGSLALGASRWQTVTRIVVPAAAPGLFAATMIGLGRAVGETMIVLMATGNTPIMDWSPFNGFRTLSANIAVEIPEAPHGGTLYRTLFVAALLLFILTFVLNTAAEIVRQALRRRFGRH